MQRMQTRARSVHLWITLALARYPTHRKQSSSMSYNDLNAFQLCSTSGQDKNRPLWQVIPQRKVFNTCFQISILKESKQTAGGHGMSKLQTLEQFVWKRYECHNDGLVMQCYSRLFSTFKKMMALNVTREPQIPTFQASRTYDTGELEHSVRRNRFHRDRFRSRHSSFNPLWVD